MAACLVGIVGMRVEVLKLGSDVGRQLQQTTTLESSDAVLRARVSALSSNQRIEQLATSMGMVMPGPMDVHFVSATDGTRVGRAISSISTPEPETFLTGLLAERSADTSNELAAADISAVGVLNADSTGDTGTVGGGAVGSGAGTTDAPGTSTGGVAGTSSTYDASTTTGGSATGGTADSTAGGTSGAAQTPPNNTSAGTPGSTQPASNTEGTSATGSTDTVGAVSGTSGTTNRASSTNGGAGIAG